MIGGSAIDITATLDSQQQNVSQTTAPGSVSLSVGGVARNIAEAAHRVLSSSAASAAQSASTTHENSVPSNSENEDATLLITPVGHDEFANFLIDEQKRLGMRDDGLMKTRNERTAVCNVLLDSNGALVNGVADMDIIKNVDAEIVCTVWFCGVFIAHGFLTYFDTQDT